MRRSLLRLRRSLARSFAIILVWTWVGGCAVIFREQESARFVGVTKDISFAILEDYDKGDDLREIEKDFQLMNELGIDVLRCSFGWDDYEPVPGQYDFVWLKDFVRLAATYKLKLRPYIGYTPRWAGTAGSDDVDWNNPPANYHAWYQFVFNLASALREFPNVLSYEIYNEQNDRSWWDGSIEEYMETLRLGALAARAADPDVQIILGGLIFPDHSWLRRVVEASHARYYDIIAFHAYPETWSAGDVFVENYLNAGYRAFAENNRTLGEAEPIWINEMGFATVPGKSEAEQANWWARAVSTFLADPHIEHIGVYEIKDLPLGKDVIGDDKNYHLGITRADRSKKLAFYTVAMLHRLLSGQITTANNEVSLTVRAGRPGDLHAHLFKRPDGKQVLFLYDKRAAVTVEARLRTEGTAAFQYDLDGTSKPHVGFDRTVLSGVRLTPGQVAIFRIDP